MGISWISQGQFPEHISVLGGPFANFSDQTQLHRVRPYILSRRRSSWRRRLTGSGPFVLLPCNVYGNVSNWSLSHFSSVVSEASVGRLAAMSMVRERSSS